MINEILANLKKIPSKRKLRFFIISHYALLIILDLATLRVFMPSMLGISYFNIGRFPKIFGTLKSNLSFLIISSLAFFLHVVIFIEQRNLIFDLIENSNIMIKQLSTNDDRYRRESIYEKKVDISKRMKYYAIGRLSWSMFVVTLKTITPISNNSFIAVIKNANSFLSYISAFILLIGVLDVLCEGLYYLKFHLELLHDEIQLSLRDNKIIIDFFEKDLKEESVERGENIKYMVENLVVHPFSAFKYFEAKGVFSEIEECKN